MSTIVFKAEDTEPKPIKTGKRAGENYLRVKIEGGPWASVWGKQDANTILQNEGAFFKAEREDDDTYGASLSKVSVSSDEVPAGINTLTDAYKSSGGKGTLSKEEWALKDRKDWMRRLYMGHLANLTAVLEPGVGWDFYEKQVIRKARAYANSDLQWIEGGGTEEPF